MTEENKKAEEQGKENKFEKEQPLRHSLASVVQDGKSLKIIDQLYSVFVNERIALDI